MSGKIGSKISEGACAEVFKWEDNKKVIKLAKANTDLYAMQREYYNSKIVWDNGLSVPKPFELMEVEGRPGIVFERIYGQTLTERFIEQFIDHSSKDGTKEFNYDETETRISAKILSEVHSKSVHNMPSQRESVMYSINQENYLTKLEKESVINILNNIPIKQQLCHGDPNPNNILISGDKAVLIDWMDASTGNPEADLAKYIIMIRFAILPTYIPNEVIGYFDSIRGEIIRVFIDEYMKLSDININEIDDWIIPVTACKLASDGISEDEKKLLVNEIRKRLGEKVNI